MNFKEEILRGLRQGADASALREVVHRFKAGGGTQREAYDLLEEVWRDLGFAEDQGGCENPTRDELEYLMELVWGFCGTEEAIWETSLSNP
jgi:hypothetical protein